MADDSHLEYLKTFFSKVHTTMTFKHFKECKSIYNDEWGAAVTERGLLYLPEIVGSSDYWVEERFPIKLISSTEEGLLAAINNIIAGIRKLNRWQAITSYTREASLQSIRLYNSNKGYINDDGYCENTVTIVARWTV